MTDNVTLTTDVTTRDVTVTKDGTARDVSVSTSRDVTASRNASDVTGSRDVGDISVTAGSPSLRAKKRRTAVAAITEDDFDVSLRKVVFCL